MLRFLIEKEFKQMLRNKALPGIIFGMPFMMMILLPWAANQEVKNINLTVIDNNQSTYSQRLTQKITASGYFKLKNFLRTNAEGLNEIEATKSDIILEIPSDFESDLVSKGVSKVMISANAVNSTRGSLGSAYLANILNDFSSELRNETTSSNGKMEPNINIVTDNKFNPHLNYQILMVPALIVMLLTMLCGFMPALNIVGEKELGTIEQMNVTPVKKLNFILAKLIPYWIIGIIVMTISFGLAALIYNLYPSGSLLTIYFFAGIYILAISGFGLVVSNYSNTVQQAMFVMYFFIMILNLMSGLFTPVISMPDWAQNIVIFNPLHYFIDVMRMVYLKGSSIMDLSKQFIALASFAIVFNTVAVFSYKKSM